MVRVEFTVAVWAGEPESVTLKLSGVPVTGAEGVPVICPVDAFSVNPVGKAPAVNCQVYAPNPPVARSVCEYGAPTVPLGRDVVKMVNAATTDTFAVLPAKRSEEHTSELQSR